MNLIIPKELASKIVVFFRRRNVEEGETIVAKNSANKDLYIISTGRFKVYDDSAGKDFVLAMLKRGDIFGEMSFLDGSIRSASVTATCSGSLLIMGEEEFSVMLAEQPEITVQFIKFLSGAVCSRLRLANEALLKVAFGDSETIHKENAPLKEAIAEMHAAVRMELENN